MSESILFEEVIYRCLCCIINIACVRERKRDKECVCVCVCGMYMKVCVWYVYESCVCVCGMWRCSKSVQSCSKALVCEKILHFLVCVVTMSE